MITDSHEEWSPSASLACYGNIMIVLRKTENIYSLNEAPGQAEGQPEHSARKAFKSSGTLYLQVMIRQSRRRYRTPARAPA